MPRIIPAILEKDIKEVERKLNKVSGFAEITQIDIADGRFVHNTTISLAQLKGISFSGGLELHLMVEAPLRELSNLGNLNLERVFIHYEAISNDASAVLKELSDFHFAKGLAINPDTAVEAIYPFLDKLDAVLVMGVQPGFQGAGFIEAVWKKVSLLRAKSHNTLIAVDGGVNEQNIQALAVAGADDFIIGSVLFNAEDIVEEYKKLKHILAGSE